jgi:hypothetical protein
MSPRPVNRFNTVAKKKIRRPSYTFLIDGSGSMSSMNPLNPIQHALKTTAKFSEITETNAAAVFFSTDGVTKYCTYSGSDFVPAIHYMASCAGYKKKKHFVVLSDGEIGDKKESLSTAQVFLTVCPTVTIDFAVISDNAVSTPLTDLAKDLQKEFPKQITLTMCTPEHPLGWTLANIAKAREQQRSRKKSAPKPE